MRLFEIASAEDQLALLRIIFDNTWGAVALQAKQEQRAKAQSKPKSALKPAPYASPPPPLPKNPKQRLKAPPALTPAPTMQSNSNTLKPVRSTAKAQQPLSTVSIQ